MNVTSCREHVLAGAVLVVAVPAIGNTGQLATDLMITRCGGERVAVLESTSVLPVVGNEAYPSSSKPQLRMCTCLELFSSVDQSSNTQRCFFLQQRGPVATGRQKAFARELSDWISVSKFSQVVLLSSIDASVRQDREIVGSRVAFASESEGLAHSDQLTAAGIQPILADILAEKDLELRKCAPWPAYAACLRAALPATLLVAFSTGGSSVGEATALASAAALLLPAACFPAGDGRSSHEQWVMPPSWAPLVGA